MNESSPPPSSANAMMDWLAQMGKQSQQIIEKFLQQQPSHSSMGTENFFNVGQAFQEYLTQLLRHPDRLWQYQMAWWEEYQKLWQSTWQRMAGNAPVPPSPMSQPQDKRFKDSAWQENVVFDYLKQSYLLSAKWMLNLTREAKDLDPQIAKKVDFYLRQFVDALSPSNFLLTNPEILRTTINSKGQNLVQGLQNLLRDLEKGRGHLQITMTDPNAFQLGGNIATSPGQVVYQNSLMQLIQYNPTTEKVYERPLLVIPPWINKYYILDLRENNSFVRWATGQGHTVFMISWVNPDEKLAGKTFEDYMQEGILAAIETIQQITKAKGVNAVGYCLGGTLLACTLAYLEAQHKKAKNKKSSPLIHSATYLSTLVDFTEPGELGVFIDEVQLQALEKKMQATGYLSGSEMATTFNLLRANDLIWSFVINNYLLGKEPMPFDLLYWNSDSTRMPAQMHSFYLRNMYLENKLVKGELSFSNIPLDLTQIQTPSYILATKEDHIAPWKSVYAATQLYRGDRRFVLGGSGHIAGVINAPATNKYAYWTHDKLPGDPEKWLQQATQHPGSWWSDWQKWVVSFTGEQTTARNPGDNGWKVIEPAPGSYVKVR